MFPGELRVLLPGRAKTGRLHLTASLQATFQKVSTEPGRQDLGACKDTHTHAAYKSTHGKGSFVQHACSLRSLALAAHVPPAS